MKGESKGLNSNCHNGSDYHQVEEVVTIATDKGFLIAVVLVLALAVFSGSLRDRYSTSGYATYGERVYGSHGFTCEEQCFARLETCRGRDLAAWHGGRRFGGQGETDCNSEYKECVRAC